MRRFFNALAVSALVVFLSVPVSAAPRRDDGGSDFVPTQIRRIVELIKRVVRTLDGGDMSIPKP